MAVSEKRVYLVELEAWDAASNVLTTLYYSNYSFVTAPTDTPANTIFIARLLNALEFGRDMYTEGSIGGESFSGSGFIELDNSDGALNSLYADLLLVGRSVSVKYATAGSAFNDFTVILEGVTDSVEFSTETITINLKDNQKLLDVEISPNTYDTTGPNTTFNTSLHGKPLPLCYGECYNVSPRYVGKVESLGVVTDLTYQVHDGPIEDILAVYSNGNQISAGNIVKDLPNGKFTILNAATSGFTITADVKGCNNPTYVDRVPDIIERILTVRVPDVVIAPSKLATLATDSAFEASPIASASPAGIYLREGANLLEVIEELSASVGAYYGFDRLGRFDIGVFTEPDDQNVVAILTDSDIIDISRLPVALPRYEHSLNYKKNYNVFGDNDLAEIVKTEQPDRHTFLIEEYRTATADIYEAGILKADNVTVESFTDTATHWTISDRYPTAQKAEPIESLLINEAQALLEARRRWHLYNNVPGGLVQRDHFTVTLKTQPFQLQLNDTVQIFSRKHNLPGGKLFRIVSFTESAFQNEVTIDIWG